MNKTAKILLGILLSLSIIGTGFWLFYTGSPEYALKQTIHDVQERGSEGLKDHVTDTLRTEIEVMEMISSNPLISYIAGAVSDQEATQMILSEIQEIDWTVDDVIRSQKQAQVIMRFQYKDSLKGTIPIKMIKDSGKWKISGIGIPKSESILPSGEQKSA